jgi:hypothetical protein
MFEINLDELDERTARVMLASASGPGDPEGGHLVQVWGPVVTVWFLLEPPDSGALSLLTDSARTKTVASWFRVRGAQEAFEPRER